MVWRGAHAWVMSGFTATADPAHTGRFQVRSVFIQDVWYPRVSSIWGRSRPPNAEVPVGALSADYLRYDRPGRVHPNRDGRYVLIEPMLPPARDHPIRDDLAIVVLCDAGPVHERQDGNDASPSGGDLVSRGADLDGIGLGSWLHSNQPPS